MPHSQLNYQLLRETILKNPDTSLFASIMTTLEDDREVRQALAMGTEHVIADTLNKGGNIKDAIRKLFYIALERGITYQVMQGQQASAGQASIEVTQ